MPIEKSIKEVNLLEKSSKNVMTNIWRKKKRDKP